ncbi:MAG: site-specific integrase [Chitinophagaceae bacterium]|nr:MAG: site-specific integrase [Chitinophagaceae bacterium]
MLQQRVSIQFRLKQKASRIAQPQAIHMRITLMGKRFELSTGRMIELPRWNQRAGKVSGTKEDARAINAYLDTWSLKVREAEQELLQRYGSFSIEELRSKLTGKDLEKSKTLLFVFTEHNDRLLALVSRGEYAKGTHTHFETTKRHVREFLVKYKQKSDCALREVNYAFVQDFEYYLKLDICDHNTAMKYLGDLKKITTLAIHRGDLEKDPFGGYKLTRRKVTKDFLMMEEVDHIAAKDFGNVRLSQVRDIFVFSCFTGLAYANVLKLKSSEIRAGFDGEKWLFIDRQKTGSPSPVPLLPTATRILAKNVSFSKE